MAIGILGLGERQRVRLFVSRDQLDRFVACTLCLPRDRFNTENRQRAGAILADAFGGGQVDWRLQLSESRARPGRLRVRCPDGVPTTTTSPAIEARIAEATRAWTDDLRAALIVGARGAGRARALRRASATPSRPPTEPTGAPRARSSTSTGSRELERTGRPILALYRTLRRGARGDPLPAAERGERSRSQTCCRRSSTWAPRSSTSARTRSAPTGSPPVWIYDFGLSCPPSSSSAPETRSPRRFWASGPASSRTIGSTRWCCAPG